MASKDAHFALESDAPCGYVSPQMMNCVEYKDEALSQVRESIQKRKQMLADSLIKITQADPMLRPSKFTEMKVNRAMSSENKR